MANKELSISVILPNYNGKHLLEMYLPTTVEALICSNVNYEIIVIDDCSTDESIAFIQNNYPDIILLKNEKNSGFSYTCNRGIAVATKDLVLLLNTDVKLTANYFEQQFKYFDKDDTFGVMGRIMSMDGSKIEDAARLPYFKGSKFKANKFYFITDQDHRTLTCYLSGANALVKREKLLLLNGFDEIYSPFYFEDFDLGLRAWRLGWRLYYEHEAVCYHQISSSTNKLNQSNFVQITYNRNSFILQSIHLQGLKRITWYVQLFTITLIGHVFKGQFWIFKSLAGFLTKKEEIQISRKNIKTIQEKLGVNYNLNNIISAIRKSKIGKKINWLKL